MYTCKLDIVNLTCIPSTSLSSFVSVTSSSGSISDSSALETTLTDLADDLPEVLLPGMKDLSVDKKLLSPDSRKGSTRGEGLGASEGVAAKLTVDRRFLFDRLGDCKPSSSASLPPECVLFASICRFLETEMKICSKCGFQCEFDV